MKNFTILAFIFFTALFSGCEKFEYSPYQDDRHGELPSNLNNTNLNRLLSNSSDDDDTVTIIYTGDSQRFYDRLDDLVAKVNSLQHVDFLIICGDIADFGILQEYVWVCDRLKKLNVPYLAAVGNHDLTADNGDLFTKIFGEKNFSFTYKKYKFLFHDTNGREYNFNGHVPDVPWLSSQLDDAQPEWFVGVSHVPPYDVDFDPVVENPYKELWASDPRFILSLHGHLHSESDSYPYSDGVRYMTSNAVVRDEALLLKFFNGQIIKEKISY